MREILFRGKQIRGSEWFVGDLSRVVHDDGRCYVFPSDGYNSPDWYEVDPEIVGRYTGLTDKNGVKIFEGDIVFAKYKDGYEAGRFEVKFGKCGGIKNVNHDVGYIGFYFKEITDSVSLSRDDPLYWINEYECEVIGNVHDNPELLEEVHRKDDVLYVRQKPEEA